MAEKYFQPKCRQNSYDDKDSALIVEYNKNIFEAKRKREELNNFLETEYSNYYDLKYSSSMMTLSEVQDNLTEDELIIEYVLNAAETNTELLSFVISKTKSFTSILSITAS